MHRRELLRTGLYSAGLGLLPASIARALTIPPKVVARDIRDVQHVVILMQENRSFDQYFGLLKGVRGFGDRFMPPRYNGESHLVQRNAERTVLPYYLDRSQGNALVVGTPHSWGDAHEAWDGGRMTHWPVAKHDVSMGYLKDADLPYHTALANTFTLCDHYHCALPGGTNSNRIHLWTGTNRGTTARSDGAEMCVVNNDGWDTVDGTPQEHSLTWTTYPERLQEAGVSWKVYQFLPDNFTDNALSGFRNFREAYGRVNQGNLASYNSAETAPAVDYVAAVHDQPDSPLYEPLYKGIGKTEPGWLADPLVNFRAEALAGTLPQVSWLVPPKNYTEHPGGGPPALGAAYISQVLDALTANPETWAKTVFFINYDENDGAFDHLAPPCPPSPLPGGGHAGKSTVDTTRDYMTVPNATNLEPGDGRPYGPGPRVPMLVISPWSRGGYVNSQVHDHTSVIRFLEQRFGVMEPNISPWRRAVMGDFLSAFDFATPDEDRSFLVDLPVQDPATAAALYLQQSSQPYVEPPAEDAQSLPLQTPGSRPARPLPYRLEVDATADAGGVTLEFHNSGTAGAVFHVYDRYRLGELPRRYTVEAGRSLSDRWLPAATDSGLYDLWVLGPNGFHRLFRGSAAAPALALRARSEQAPRRLWLELANRGGTTVELTISAAAHRDGASQTLVLQPGAQARPTWPLDTSEGWYDFTVSGPGGLLRRYAGHVEHGAASVSDPEMGAAQAVAPFAFAARGTQRPDTQVESDAVRLAGFSGYLPVRAEPGTELSLDGGPWVVDAPPVCAGQSLRLRHRAAATLDTEARSAVFVGTHRAEFVSRTAETLPPVDPGPGPGTPAPPAPAGRFGGGALVEAVSVLGAAALARAARRHAKEAGD